MTKTNIRATVRKLQEIIQAETRNQSKARRAEAVRLWQTVSGSVTAERLLGLEERMTLGTWFHLATTKAA